MTDTYSPKVSCGPARGWPELYHRGDPRQGVGEFKNLRRKTV